MKLLSILLLLSLVAGVTLAQVEGGPPPTRKSPTIDAPQWQSYALGTAGEPSISTDNKGHVYVAAHLYNGQNGYGIFYASGDWGQTYTRSHVFSGAWCDFDCKPAPNGRIHVVFMGSSVTGDVGAVSSDFGATFYQTKQILWGQYDREWFDFQGNNVFIDYSDGYIGGPTSKGVYVSKSTDNGATYTGYVRADNEVSGVQAVDPGIACSPTVVLAGWNTSNDGNNCQSCRVSRSTDGGATFTNHTTIANYNGSIGDIQERWTAQITPIAAPNNVFYVFYQNYDMVTVDGVARKAFLAHYRKSTDGGLTWGPDQTVATLSDIVNAVRLYYSRKWTNNSSVFPYYIQCEPWATVAPSGVVHVVWYDNRYGENTSPNLNSNWTVYHTQTGSRSDHWMTPDQVATPFLCVRPTLDFISVAADNKYVYCAWVKHPAPTSTGWWFWGSLYASRRAVNVPNIEDDLPLH